MGGGLFEGRGNGSNNTGFSFRKEWDTLQRNNIAMYLKHRKGNLICIDGKVSFQKEVEWASFMFNWKCSGNIQSLQIPLIWQFEFSNSKRLIWSPFQLDICQKGKGLGVFRPFSMELLTPKKKFWYFLLIDLCWTSGLYYYGHYAVIVETLWRRLALPFA